MSLSFRSSATGSSGTSTSTITIPADVQVGDLLYVDVVSRGHTGADALWTVTDNDGTGDNWTQGLIDANRRSGFFWKRATAATAGKTITVAGGLTSVAAVVTAYIGAILTGTPYTDSLVTTCSAGTETVAALVPDQSGCMIHLVVHNVAGNNAVTSPACTDPGALTNRAEHLSTGGSGSAVMHSSELQTSGTTTGAFTWSQTDAATRAHVRATLPEPAAGGGSTSQAAILAEGL